MMKLSQKLGDKLFSFLLFAVPILLPTNPLYGAEKSSPKKAPLTTLLQENKALKEFAEVPAFLQIIKTILQKKGITPFTQATNLYTRYHALIENLWACYLPHYTQQEREYTEALLSYIAIHTLQQSELIIDSAWIHKARTTLKGNGKWKGGNEKNGRQLLEGTPLFTITPQQQTGDATPPFIHPTIQAYYAAHYLKYIKPDTLPNTLRQHKYHPRYQLVCRFYIGLLHNEPIAIHQFMQQLDSQPRDLIGYAHTMLQARLLSEVTLPDKVMQQLTQKCGLASNLPNWFNYIFQKEGEQKYISNQPLLTAFTTSIASLPTSPLKTELIKMTWLPKLTDKKATIRCQAATALGELGDSNMLRPLLDQLEAQHKEVRRHVATALGELGDGRALSHLLKALQDEDGTVLCAVAEALGKLNLDAGAFPTLLDALKSSHRNVPCYAAAALRKLGTHHIPSLLGALKDKDEKVRRYVATALGEIGDTRALPNLLGLYQDERAIVRSHIATALGKLGDEKALPHLLDALQDEDYWVRRSAASALGELGNSTAVPPLLKTLTDKKPSVRSATAGALGKIGDADALPGLLQALEDPKYDVRRRVVVALGEIGDVKAVPHLVHILQDQYESEYVIAAVATALGKLKHEAAVNPLIHRLNDEFNNVVKAAHTALKGFKMHQEVPLLRAALQATNPAIRLFAQVALQQGFFEYYPYNQEYHKVTEPLIQALQDENNNVRLSVIRILGELGGAWTLMPLMNMLRATKWRVRSYAATTLGELGNQEAVPYLIGTLKDIAWQVRTHVAFALGKLGDCSAIPPLEHTLQDSDWGVRGAAVVALGQLRDSKALPILLAALKDKHEEVRWRAVVALGQLEVTTVVPPLLEALQDEHGDVIRKAANTLGALGDERALPPLLEKLQHFHEKVRSDVTVALGNFNWPSRLKAIVPAIDKAYVQTYLIGASIKMETPLWVNEAHTQLYFIEIAEGYTQCMSITPTHYTALRKLSSIVAGSYVATRQGHDQ